jgi:hypothetical protein
VFFFLQKTNARFQDTIYDLEHRLDEPRPHDVDPETLRRRLGDVLHAVRTGKVGYFNISCKMTLNLFFITFKLSFYMDNLLQFIPNSKNT